MDLRASNIDRLLAALHHQKLDRVPNFEIWIGPRTISHVLNRKVDQGLWDVPEPVAVEVAQAVGQDAIPCPLKWGLPDASVRSLADLKNVVIPDAREMREKLQRALAATKGTRVGVCPCLSGPITRAYMCAGPVSIQSFMYMLYDAPELVTRLMDIFLNYDLQVIEAIRDLPFHFYYIGDDIGSTKGSMFSPAHLAEFWAPREEKLIRAAQATGRPILCHCCGDQSPVLPYFQRWGVNAVHPIQPVANDIYAVHRQYGSALTLVGNIDINLLSTGTQEQVRHDVKEHIQRLAADGGYVVCSSHSIIDSVIPENYVAMITAA